MDKKTNKYEYQIIEKNINANYGAEALSYIEYICDNYENLPEKIVFIHGHEHSYHQQYNIFDSIEKYKNYDYKNINGDEIFSFHHLSKSHPWFPKGELNYSLFDLFWSDLMYKFGEPPEKLFFQPCAQFIVDKNLILSNTIDFYIDIKKYILEKKLGKIIAVFLEFVWHIIFNKNALDSDVYKHNIDQYCMRNNIDIFIQNGNHKESFFSRPYLYISKNGNWLNK